MYTNVVHFEIVLCQMMHSLRSEHDDKWRVVFTAYVSKSAEVPPQWASKDFNGECAWILREHKNMYIQWG